MSLVIDMKTRAVLHTSGDDEERTDRQQSEPGTAQSAWDLRLVSLERDRMDAWRKWVPHLLPRDEDSNPDEG